MPISNPISRTLKRGLVSMLLITLLAFSFGSIISNAFNVGIENAGPTFSMLSGRNIVVGILPEPPYVKIEKQSGKIMKVEGFVPEIVQWLAEKYNFSYTFIQPADKAYGAQVNGTWNGLVGMVIREEIDIAATNLGITYLRSLYLDFSYAFANDRMTLLVPYPRLASTIMGVVRPFHYMVWIGLIISFIVVGKFLWLIMKIENQTISINESKQRNLSEQFWFIFRTILNAADVFKFQPSAQILVAAWCLAGFVFVQSYTSCLVSYLTAPKFIPFVNNIEELANSNDITLVIWKYTTMEPFFLGATSGPIAKIGKKLRNHPENILSSYENVENIISHERKVAAYLEFVSAITFDKDLKKTNECRLAKANIYFYDARCGLALPKSSPFTHTFSKDLVRMSEMGLIEYWTNSYLPKPNRCSSQLTNLRPPRGKMRLTINFLSSAFILYGVGMVLSIIAFVYERVKCNRQASI